MTNPKIYEVPVEGEIAPETLTTVNPLHWDDLHRAGNRIEIAPVPTGSRRVTAVGASDAEHPAPVAACASSEIVVVLAVRHERRDLVTDDVRQAFAICFPGQVPLDNVAFGKWLAATFHLQARVPNESHLATVADSPPCRVIPCRTADSKVARLMTRYIRTSRRSGDRSSR